MAISYPGRAAGFVLALSLVPALVRGDVVADPTAGIALPATPLAGDAEATMVSTNPAGLGALGGARLDLAVVGLDPSRELAGSGVGLFVGVPVVLPLLPRIALGFGLEKLISVDDVVPDTGSPTRASLVTTFGGPRGALGIAWRHFFAAGESVDGVDTIDLGLATRLGRGFAFGVVLRDLTTPVAAGVPTERTYGAELLWRPTGTDRLELAAGAELGERRLGVDPRVRLGLRVGRGAWLRAEVRGETRWATVATTSGVEEDERFDVVGSLGLDLSFGRVGVSTWGTGGRIDGAGRFLGGAAVVRLDAAPPPSVLGRQPYLGKLELDSSLSDRALVQTVARLERMRRDPACRAVIVSIQGPELGWAAIDDLRSRLLALRAAGKPVYAYLAAASLRDYALATAADQIWLDPAGGLRIQGVSTTVLYFKQLFDRLDVVAQFEKIEEYKSAPEAWTRDAPTEEAREMRAWILDGLYGRALASIAKARRKSLDATGAAIEGGPYTAAEALTAGLVDKLAEPKEVDRLLSQQLGGLPAVMESPPAERDDRWGRRRIAVVTIDGDIVDGQSSSVPLIGRKLAGGETIAGALALARSHPGIDAVILRVDSPGGSALASEVISREVFQTRGVKPMIVSMGDVAASGGYFAAAGGDLIFAQPSTVTGSIGIFTGKFDVSGLLAKVGITWDTMLRGPRADMEAFTRGYTEEERKLIHGKLRYFYERFTGAVAKGRGLTMAAVDKVGRGQVWTGEQALGHKLVDRLGGFAEALNEAKVRAGIPQDELVELVFLPRPQTNLLEMALGLGTRLEEVGEVELEGALVPDAPIAGAGITPLSALSPLGALFAQIPGSLLVGAGVPQARLPFAFTLAD